MKKKIILFLFIFPVAVLACLILYRKNHGVISTQGGVTPSGTAFITGDALHRSNTIWTNRAFITVKENDEAFRAVETLAKDLPVSTIVKSNAVQICIQIIKAYGRGDWDAFLAARVPFPDYALNYQSVAALEREAKRCNITNISKVTTGNVLDIYHLVWNDMVNTNGLFSEISFMTNSITVVETSQNHIAEVAVPSFTAKTNENYFTINSSSILDYSAKLSLHNPQQIEALRFFFFSKEGERSNFYMFIFALNEQNGVWIPWRLSVGLIAAPSHVLPIF